MKKLMTMGLLAALIAVTSAGPTHAWSKFNWGAGFNVGWEGGGNSAFWGLIKGENSPYAGISPPCYGGVSMPAYTPSMGGVPSMPSPEKISPPTPLKPASYSAPQQPEAVYQQPAADSGYAAPSYWYDR